MATISSIGGNGLSLRGSQNDSETALNGRLPPSRRRRGSHYSERARSPCNRAKRHCRVLRRAFGRLQRATAPFRIAVAGATVSNPDFTVAVGAASTITLDVQSVTVDDGPSGNDSGNPARLWISTSCSPIRTGPQRCHGFTHHQCLRRLPRSSSRSSRSRRSEQERQMQRHAAADYGNSSVPFRIAVTGPPCPIPTSPSPWEGRGTGSSFPWSPMRRVRRTRYGKRTCRSTTIALSLFPTPQTDQIKHRQ